MDVTGRDWTRALTALNQAERKMPGAFREIGTHEQKDLQDAISTMIMSAGEIKRSKVVETFMRYADVYVIEGIVKALEMSHIVRIDTIENDKRYVWCAPRKDIKAPVSDGGETLQPLPLQHDDPEQVHEEDQSS